MDKDAIDARLAWIDRRLAEIPHGQIFVERRGARAFAVRVRKEDGRNERHFLGEPEGPTHREARALLEERRALSVERRDLWRHREADVEVMS